MPDPSTTRISLYKSKSDGSELVNYTQDIGQNWDKVDAAVGFQAVTSSTRPSSPYSGKPIFETDTSYRTYYSNGTSPASASWIEIPNGSAQFNSTLRLASGKQINVNSSASGATIAVVNAATTTDLLSSRVSGDTVDRFEVETDGTHNWGAGGSTAADTNLFRDSANVLRTNDSLTVDINLSVAGSGSVTGALGVGGNLAVSATTWTTYTPTWGNVGSATFTTNTGFYYKLGKIVFVLIYATVNVAGTGTSIVTVTMPSNVERTARQALTVHLETVGANGNATSGIRGGECVFFTGGTGAIADRIRVDNGTSNESNVQGVDLLNTGTITIQGWYREA